MCSIGENPGRCGLIVFTLVHSELGRNREQRDMTNYSYPLHVLGLLLYIPYGFLSMHCDCIEDVVL